MATDILTPPDFTSQTITASDIASLLQLDICKFRFDTKDYTAFSLIVTRQLAATLPSETLFHESVDIPSPSCASELRLAFLPVEGFPRPVLLSDEDKIELSMLFSCGVYSLEGNFVIHNLLPSGTNGRRAWTTYPQSECMRRSTVNHKCLLAVVSSAGPEGFDEYPIARVDLELTRSHG